MLEDEITHFLESYADAFNQVESTAIAKMYHLPSFTIRGDGSLLVFNELDEVREFMGSVAQTYYDEGNRASTFDELSVVPIGGECALATLKWTIRKEGGEPIRAWRQSYNLIRAKDEWQFLLSMFHR